MFTLVNALIEMVLLVPYYFFFIIGTVAESDAMLVVAWIFYVPALLYSFAVLVPGLAVTVRRLQDTGRAWPNIFMGLIPFAGPVILIVWACQDGQPFENEWGPDPKAGERGEEPVANNVADAPAPFAE